MKRKIIQALLGVFVVLCLLVLVGEKAPGTSDAYFWGVKAGALAALVLSGMALYRLVDRKK